MGLGKLTLCLKCGGQGHEGKPRDTEIRSMDADRGWKHKAGAPERAGKT